ncbi:class I adenylate-forming enzyme family protein [Sphingomonas montanisoli]|uniref:AMP-binding protein n=1 Tax=Sphingomonas montanisoli TaxID=2606412 RepID=A0A5D9C0J8_9SPHN|nr:AMP-binding protein [Sphingomonas montanisoli]TZG25179.1 AMP-binding protein [Sphingomonas montanisoli]
MSGAIDRAEAMRRVMAPGSDWEVVTETVDGEPLRLFRGFARTLPELYQRALDTYGDRILFVDGDVHFTYADIFGESARLAVALRDRFGVGEGTRVGIVMQNCREYLTSFTAVTMLGGVGVLINSRGAGGEIARAIEDTDCALVIGDGKRIARLLAATNPPPPGGGGAKGDGGGGSETFSEPPSSPSVNCADTSPWRGRIERAMPLIVTEGDLPGATSYGDLVAAVPETPFFARPADPGELAAMMFTSGTTGRPKGAALSHRSMLAGLSVSSFSNAVAAEMTRAAMGPAAEPMLARQQATIMIAPLFHVSGLHNVYLRTLAAGGRIYRLARWNPEQAIRLIAEHAIASIGCVPTMMWDILRSPIFGDHDLSSLRSIGAGGAPFPDNLVREMKEKLPNCTIGMGYGMTESNGAGTNIAGPDLAARPGAVGRPNPLTDIRVVDDHAEPLPQGETGEIAMRGSVVMQGYFGNAAATAAKIVDGWLLTGDVGRFDADGYLHLVDRKTQMIISGGENIYCAEVEAALSTHPDVREVVAVGVPDDRLGEALVAAIVAQPGVTIDADALDAHVRTRLADYKAPRDYVIQSDPFDRTANAKIDRRAVTQMVRARFAAETSA